MAGCVVILGFFTLKIYPELEYSGYGGGHSCTGECYEEYVRINGTSVDILKAKQALAATDEFSSIRSLWAGCAACHGNEGQGMVVFPALAGKSADYITDRLRTYKNGGEVILSENKNLTMKYGCIFISFFRCMCFVIT